MAYYVTVTRAVDSEQIPVNIDNVAYVETRAMGSGLVFSPQQVVEITESKADYLALIPVAQGGTKV